VVPHLPSLCLYPEKDHSLPEKMLSEPELGKKTPDPGLEGWLYVMVVEPIFYASRPISSVPILSRVKRKTRS
jgi:hypothetical protein